MNVIMGLPRSGSTALCNVLAQNPNNVLEHTNPLPQVLGAMVQVWSSNPDIKGGLQEPRREETEHKLLRCARSVVDAWGNVPTGKTYWNKSRGWGSNLLMLHQIDPEAKVIVTVRDLREVFASFEKQHQKFPLLDDSHNLQRKHIYQRALDMFAPQGMIGSCLQAIKDILDRQQDVFFVRYEDFVANPGEMMERLYAYCGLPYYAHQFDNVENTATDPDHIYNNKYPHKGEGKIEPRPPGWPKIMGRHIAEEIQVGFPWYCDRFGYPRPRPQQQQGGMVGQQRQESLGADAPLNGGGDLPKRLKHADAQ